jgi:hypothetical protein
MHTIHATVALRAHNGEGCSAFLIFEGAICNAFGAPRADVRSKKVWRCIPFQIFHCPFPVWFQRSNRLRESRFPRIGLSLEGGAAMELKLAFVDPSDGFAAERGATIVESYVIEDSRLPKAYCPVVESDPLIVVRHIGVNIHCVVPAMRSFRGCKPSS